MKFLLLLLFLPFFIQGSVFAQDVRIEDDFSLSYPEGKSDEIVDYLQVKYIEDKAFVDNLGAEFVSAYGDEDFVDTYFDTGSLQLYKRKTGLRYRMRTDRLDPNARKSGRELIQLKLSGDNNRNEIKFDIVAPPNKTRTNLDLHPVLRIISETDRDILRSKLAEIGVKVEAVRPILTIEQRRRRVYINNSQGTFISFSVDDAKTALWGKTITFSQMEVELNELEYTNADEETRARMQQVRQGMIENLRTKFPYLETDRSIKYTKALDKLAEKIPFAKLLIRVGILRGQEPYPVI